MILMCIVAVYGGKEIKLRKISRKNINCQETLEESVYEIFSAFYRKKKKNAVETRLTVSFG